jgi:hypothetical protein
MMEGKMKEATKLQTETTSGSPMKLNDDINAQLLEKHPSRRPPEVDTIHPHDQTAADKFHPIIFEEINAQCIQKTVLQWMEQQDPQAWTQQRGKDFARPLGNHQTTYAKQLLQSQDAYVLSM